MELSDLSAYARDMYQIEEDHKWQTFPGFSALCHPQTGKWVALLMRQWDSQTGSWFEHCDLRCGARILQKLDRPYLSSPFRMKGVNWVGITFDRRTEKDVVLALFDRAISGGAPGEIVIQPAGRRPEPSASSGEDSDRIYTDTPLHFGGTVRKGFPPAYRPERTKSASLASHLHPGYRPERSRSASLASRLHPGYRSERTRPSSLASRLHPDYRPERTKPASLASRFPPDGLQTSIADIADRSVNLPGQSSGTADRSTDLLDPPPDLPDRIREMISLYEYGNGSPAEKARNFVQQGRFMEDYEDNMPWEGKLHRYFMTYHDLNLRQLRGYFTWRTRLREGNWQPITLPLAYIYLYELLCGIGTDSPQDAIDKLNAFETGFLDAGYGNLQMRLSLRAWRLAYTVMHGLPTDQAERFQLPLLLKQDRALAVLRTPGQHTDAEILSALACFADRDLNTLVSVKKTAGRGEALFAGLWRHLTDCYPAEEQGDDEGRSIFARFFGRPQTRSWHPFSNAVYWEEPGQPDRDYILNECRSYSLRKGLWQETCYDRALFELENFHGLLREADRLFRIELNTGHYLKAKPEEAWAAPYIQATIEACRRAAQEAARPKIRIDFSGLDRIRQDALATRDSLLIETDENAGPELALQAAAEHAPAHGSAEDPASEAPGHTAAQAQHTDASGSSADHALSPTVQTVQTSQTAPAAQTNQTNPPAAPAAQTIQTAPAVQTNQTAPAVQTNQTAPAVQTAQTIPAVQTNQTAPAAQANQTAQTIPVTPAAQANQTAQTIPPAGRITAPSKEEDLPLQILRRLLAGQDPSDLIRRHRLMPQLVADTINETFLDEIGDSIMECEGDQLSLVEDYREDLLELL